MWISIHSCGSAYHKVDVAPLAMTQPVTFCQIGATSKMIYYVHIQDYYLAIGSLNKKGRIEHRDEELSIPLWDQWQSLKRPLGSGEETGSFYRSQS